MNTEGRRPKNARRSHLLPIATIGFNFLRRGNIAVLTAIWQTQAQ